MVTRQLHELRAADLEVSPVWCFLSEDAPDAEDECTLIPGEPGDAMFVVRATFRVADGRTFPGYVRPEEGLGFSQPCMFVGDRLVTFWSGVFPPQPGVLAEVYSLLGAGAEGVFPIRWTTDVAGVAVQAGSIEGFGFIQDGADAIVR